MHRPKDLTTTSYAILGLLSVRRWSAYDLAKQMQRSVSFIWPRAQSAIYAEPKNLVAHRYARAVTTRRGARERTEYTITAAGRRALRAWLELESAPPQFESEGAVRVWFADHGTKEALLRTLADLRRQAAEIQQRLIAIGRSYLTDGPPFPERLHVNMLVARLAHEQAAMLSRWSAWAARVVDEWDGVGPEEAWRGNALLTELVEEFIAFHASDQRDLSEQRPTE